MIDRMNRKEINTGDLSRRELIQSAAFVPLVALTLSAQSPVQQGALTPSQLKTLEAFLDRLIPRDELGPSAVDAGAQVYIDRALAGPNAGEKASFIQGLQRMDEYARRVYGSELAGLPPEKRDQVLSGMVDDPFFARARLLALEGMFSDPYYGGNRNFAGWDLIRYPGPRPAVAVEDQALNADVKPYRTSAYGAKYGH
jgi:hypothetical protein